MLIGDMIDDLAQLRAEKRSIEQLAKDLGTKITEREAELLARFDSEASEGARSNSWTASVSSSLVPTVKDWDAFHSFIIAQGWAHLLERRPSVTGCRELFEKHINIPGVEPFTKRTIRINARS